VYRGAVLSCQGIFCIEKQGLVNAVGQCMLIGGSPFRAIRSLFGRLAHQEGILMHFSGRPIRHASFFDTLCFDVIVPCVLRLPTELIVMNGDLRDVIHDVWGSLPMPIKQAGHGFSTVALLLPAIITGVREWTRITDGSSMLLIVRMLPLHFGQTRRSTSLY